jgi:hypothetical protein
MEIGYELRGKMMDAWQRMLEQIYWMQWCTPVFSKHLMHMKPENAIKFIRNTFIGGLRKAYPGIMISFFVVIEFYRLGGVHAHLLFSSFPDVIPYAVMGTAWRNACGVRSESGLTIIEPAGYFEARRYKHDQGAGGYVGKYLSKDLCASDWDLKDSHRWENVLAHIKNNSCKLTEEERWMVGSDHCDFSEMQRQRAARGVL